MKHILQDNALESWDMAIKYCNAILAGKATLGYRKFFVSSLHNAVELFIKQRMLDINDYRVVEIKSGLSADGQPARDYYNAVNLNEFFESQDMERKKQFYSIEFNKIVQISKDIFQEYFDNYGDKEIVYDAFKLLSNLRNNEIHFYIDKTIFLLEQEFQKLHNFMIVFYGILHYYDLLPFWGEPNNREFSRFSFKHLPLTNFTYKKAVKNAKYVQQLCKDIENKIFPAYSGSSAYEIAESIACVLHEKYGGDNFNDLWVYIEMLMEYNLITNYDEVYEYELEEEGNIIQGYNAYRSFSIEL